jgi:dTDP-4-dehydrorhamnose reductase
MRILVFGKTGQVARELQRNDGVIALGRAQADLSNPAACAEIIAKTDADAVINAAAYTAVDAAEADSDMAYKVNAEAPTMMANAAAARDLPFLHISTDYVFDGGGTALWKETDMTGPLGVYGASKLAGEQGVRAADGQNAILRTSWVVSAHGANFVKTMLRLGTERDVLKVVDDQVGGPTCASDIADGLIAMAEQICRDPGKSGIYHFAGAPDVSWADFAREIFVQANLACIIEGIPSTDYPTSAARPNNSRLDCTKLTKVFGLVRPDWKIGLAKILVELKANEV